MTAPDRPRVRAQQLPWHTRFGRAVWLVFAFFGVPLVVGWLLGPAGAGWAAAVGAVLVLASSMVNGRRVTRIAAPLMLAALMLGALAKPGWTWVVLVAVLAALSGLATRRGAGVAASMVTLQAVVAPQVDDVETLLLLLGFVLAGAVYGWLMAARLGAPKFSPAPPTTPRYALTLAVALALATGLASTIAVVTGWQHATWLVAAVVVLGIPTPGLTEKLMAQRMLGQLGACGIVLLVTLITEEPLVLMAAAFASLILYLMSLGRPMAEQVTFLSAFFMLPAAATTTATLLAAQRLAYNLLGLGILALVLLALRWAGPETSAAGEPVED